MSPHGARPPLHEHVYPLGQRCELPAKHVASCNSSFSRARKAATKLEHELKAKAPERPLAGTLFAGMLTAPSWRRHSCIEHASPPVPTACCRPPVPTSLSLRRASLTPSCVRYETSCGKKANAGFDASDTHDGRGFTLTFDEIDATPGKHAESAVLGAAHRAIPRHPCLVGAGTAGSGWRSALWRSGRDAPSPMRGPTRGHALASANVRGF